MSTLPMLVRNARFGTSLDTSYVFEDHIQRALVDSYSSLSLPMIAEEVANKYDIKRDDVDEFALRSFKNWKAGNLMKFSKNLRLFHKYLFYSKEIFGRTKTI